jgi:hypothetical protein
MHGRTGFRYLAAKDIITGDTVYLDGNGDWTRDKAQFALRIEDALTTAICTCWMPRRAPTRSRPRTWPRRTDPPRQRAPGPTLPLIQIKA